MEHWFKENRSILSVCFLVTVLFIGWALVSGHVEARSGCCSWHRGVRADGCGCSDGTPLSATCAPYYTCNRNGAYSSAGRNGGSSGFGWLLGLGIVAGIIYLTNKK